MITRLRRITGIILAVILLLFVFATALAIAISICAGTFGLALIICMQKKLNNNAI